MRVSEAIHLRIGDIDSKRDVFRIVQGKGNKDRLAFCRPNYSICFGPIGGGFGRVTFRMSFLESCRKRSR